ncbi:hypothetical protein BH09SUM1_BH09SUM1_26880 [soil metagenome]
MKATLPKQLRLLGPAFNRVVFGIAAAFLAVMVVVGVLIVATLITSERQRRSEELRFETIFSQVKPGMTEGDVMRLLDKPEYKESRSGRGGTQWFYTRGLRDYYVLFDSEHKVDKTESHSI